MKTNCSKTKLSISLILSISFMIFSTGYSQPSDKNNATTVSSEIIRTMSLSANEIKMLDKAKKMDIESEVLQKKVDLLNIELIKLNELEKNSRMYKDLNSRILRQIDRYNSFELGMKFNIAEYQDVQDDILYNIYKNHYLTPEANYDPSNQFEITENDKKDVELIYVESVNMRKEAYKEHNEEKCYEDLLKSIDEKSLAIAKQEKLYSGWLNIPNKSEKIVTMNVQQ